MATVDALNLQWTIIAAAIILFLGMGGFSGLIIWAVRTGMNSVRSDLRADIAEVKAELKGDIAEVRTETAVVRTEIAELRSEFKGDITELRSEFKGDIAELRSEFKSDMAELRAELKSDMAELRSELKLDFQANRAEIITNRRMLGRFALHRHGDDGLPLAPLTDALEPLDGNDPADNENGSN